MKASTRKWLHGLIGGFVGGAAGALDSGLALLVLAPEAFNLGPKLTRTLLTVLVLGVLTGAKVAFAYLRQSPLPPADDDKPGLGDTMKKLIPLFLIGALGLGALLAFSGCKTVTRTEVINGVTNTVQVAELDPERTAGVIRAVVPVGVAIAIEADENAEAYFRAAAIVLRAAVAKGEFSPDQVQRTLETISVRELRTPEARATITAALGIYRVYFADVVDAKLETDRWVRPVLGAIADGIWDGLPPLN